MVKWPEIGGKRSSSSAGPVTDVRYVGNSLAVAQRSTLKRTSNFFFKG